MDENKKPAPFHPGEKGFAVFLMLFGGFFLWRSILLYLAHPGLGDCAALPLFLSALIILFSVCILVVDRKKESETSGKSAGETAQFTARYLFPKEVLAVILLIVVYCASLYFGLGFYIATPAFLYVGMCYLMRKNYLMNILWTALCTGFIAVIFSFVFQVMLP